MDINQVWVQCENESCLKWRSLSSEDAAKVDHDEPWFCYMNTDSRYNKCSISEEEFPDVSQLHQSGLKFVYSELPVGSLVLAKLKNLPSCPGILCPDPFERKYAIYDQDGHVIQYHIEFLGDPHSRSWIDATLVEKYNITLKPENCKKKKKWLKGALEEADILYGYSPEQRLRMCYRTKEDKSKGVAKVAIVSKKRMQVSKNNTEKKRPKVRKRKSAEILKDFFENVCSDDALSKENMAIAEAEAALKELEQMLQESLEPTATPGESEEEHKEKINTTEKLSQCIPEASTFDNHYEEDYLIVDGLKLTIEECFESIDNDSKEIDALMSKL
ncbi:zinc finger CW-type PWWP domain protein 2 [Suncus etruscus]|uniref:zinc finger CW-type PWWP domain protein 2 n=1 Tax=Suncus etruscus TaxID=109475 RepID=UPI00210F34E7|nr:zinc finger CW-type PWWP domain protein 2 [Suncus etruscus]